MASHGERLAVELLPGDGDLGAYFDERIEVGHVLVEHAHAALGSRRTDGPGGVGAVNAIVAAAQIHRPVAERIHGVAARHPAGQLGIFRQHVRRRRPRGIFALHRHRSDAFPSALLARDGDGIRVRLAGADDMIELTVAEADDDVARLAAPVEAHVGLAAVDGLVVVAPIENQSLRGGRRNAGCQADTRDQKAGGQCARAQGQSNTHEASPQKRRDGWSALQPLRRQKF